MFFIPYGLHLAFCNVYLLVTLVINLLWSTFSLMYNWMKLNRFILNPNKMKLTLLQSCSIFMIVPFTCSQRCGSAAKEQTCNLGVLLDIWFLIEEQGEAVVRKPGYLTTFIWWLIFWYEIGISYISFEKIFDIFHITFMKSGLKGYGFLSYFFTILQFYLFITQLKLFELICLLTYQII